MPSSNNKQLAKNSFALYIRMLLTTVVGLYTSRVVLNTLGVDDFGVYGLVGGVVSMLGFLNSTMSASTSRFITYELGKGDKQRLADTFSSALINHIIIAAVVLVLCETVGVWYINCKMVVAPDRLAAANWVFQFSVLSVLLTITQVPYNACIIAHEKMGVYAYVELLNVSLKLLIVYLLQVLSGDKLIIYGLLVFVVSSFIRIVYRIYCHRHFEESHFHFIWKPEILKPMLTFSGWDLYGNLASTARIQGVNMIINSFFGLALNAASTVATTVSSSVGQFAGTVVTAVKPQIIKSYAREEYDETERLIMLGCVLNFFLFSLVGIPLICEMHYVLELWLKIVPDHAVSFCQLSLIASILSSMTYIVITGIHATGKVKTVGIVLGTMYLLILPATYIPYALGWLDANLPYYIGIFVGLISIAAPAYILKSYMPSFSATKFVISIATHLLIPFTALIFIVMFIMSNMEESFKRLIYTVLLSTLLLGISSVVMVPSNIRGAVIQYVKKMFKRKKNNQ